MSNDTNPSFFAVILFVRFIPLGGLSIAAPPFLFFFILFPQFFWSCLPPLGLPSPFVCIQISNTTGFPFPVLYQMHFLLAAKIKHMFVFWSIFVTHTLCSNPPNPWMPLNPTWNSPLSPAVVAPFFRRIRNDVYMFVWRNRKHRTNWWSILEASQIQLFFVLVHQIFFCTISINTFLLITQSNNSSVHWILDTKKVQNSMMPFPLDVIKLHRLYPNVCV